MARNIKLIASEIEKNLKKNQVIDFDDPEVGYVGNGITSETEVDGIEAWFDGNELHFEGCTEEELEYLEDNVMYDPYREAADESDYREGMLSEYNENQRKENKIKARFNN